MELLYQEILHDFMACDQVEAVALAGSQVTSYEDQHSDHNFYIYTNDDIPTTDRRHITNRHLRYVEFNNQYWETEDDGQLSDGSEVRLIYRNLADFDAMLNQVVFEHRARIGQTTCFWFNLLNAQVLFDRNNKLFELQKKYRVPYPPKLKQAILQKNHGLLRRQMPAYFFQMKKAVARKDLIALNHVISNYMGSYFDILFAVNEQLHPGEKKLVAYVQKHCSLIPKNFEQAIADVLRLAAVADEQLIPTVNHMIEDLDHCIREAGKHFSGDEV